MAIVFKRPRAELDLLDIWDYIAEDSPDRADDFLDRIESSVNNSSSESEFREATGKIIIWVLPLASL